MIATLLETVLLTLTLCFRSTNLDRRIGRSRGSHYSWQVPQHREPDVRHWTFRFRED